METLNLEIRPGRVTDCVRLAEMSRKFFAYIPLSADAIFERIQKGVEYFVLVQEGRIVGFVDFEITEEANPRHATENSPQLPPAKTAKILGLCVEEHLQHQGWGTRLLNKALDEAVEKGCTTAVILVAEDNAPALALYAKFGFVQHGRLRQDLWGKRVLLCVKKLKNT